MNGYAKYLDVLQQRLMRDRLPLGKHSFLPHIVDKVFHKIFLAEGMKDIVAWNNVLTEYARHFESSVHLASRHSKSSGQIADTIRYEINVVTTHLFSILCTKLPINSQLSKVQPFNLVICHLSRLSFKFREGNLDKYNNI